MGTTSCSQRHSSSCAGIGLSEILTDCLLISVRSIRFLHNHQSPDHENKMDDQCAL